MRILIVDDDPLILRSLSRLLARRGHQVEACVDHDRAVELALTWADAALVDVDMPVRTGPELVRERFPARLPVVFHTGNPEAVPFGMWRLAKPASVEQILETLEAARAEVVFP